MCSTICMHYLRKAWRTRDEQCVGGTWRSYNDSHWKPKFSFERPMIVSHEFLLHLTSLCTSLFGIVMTYGIRSEFCASRQIAPRTSVSLVVIPHLWVYAIWKSDAKEGYACRDNSCFAILLFKFWSNGTYWRTTRATRMDNTAVITKGPRPLRNFFKNLIFCRSLHDFLSINISVVRE